jgi:hypothetical protein
MNAILLFVFTVLMQSAAPVATTPKQPIVVLPSPDLLRCSAPECQQVWRTPASPGAIYPLQVAIDFAPNGCVYGFVAYYDASVPLDSIKAALDQKYGEWESRDSKNPNFLYGYVDSLKFGIILSAAGKKNEKYGLEAGTKQLDYIAAGGTKACAAQ